MIGSTPLLSSKGLVLYTLNPPTEVFLVINGEITKGGKINAPTFQKLLNTFETAMTLHGINRGGGRVSWFKSI